MNAQPRVLLVDFEPRNIRTMTEMLQSAGYEVEVVHDGLAALEAFQNHRPDGVVLEAMLPKKHGFEVCKEMKGQPDGELVPVVITTGIYRGRKYRDQALHAFGCDEYLERPFDRKTLLEVLSRLLPREELPAEARGVEVPAAAMPASSPDPAATPPVQDTSPSVQDPALPGGVGFEQELDAHLDALIPDFGPDATTETIPPPQTAPAEEPTAATESPESTAAPEEAPSTPDEPSWEIDREALDAAAQEKPPVPGWGMVARPELPEENTPDAEIPAEAGDVPEEAGSRVDLAETQVLDAAMVQELMETEGPPAREVVEPAPDATETEARPQAEEEIPPAEAADAPETEATEVEDEVVAFKEEIAGSYSWAAEVMPDEEGDAETPDGDEPAVTEPEPAGVSLEETTPDELIYGCEGEEAEEPEPVPPAPETIEAGPDDDQGLSAMTEVAAPVEAAEPEEPSLPVVEESFTETLESEPVAQVDEPAAVEEPFLDEGIEALARLEDPADAIEEDEPPVADLSPDLIPLEDPETQAEAVEVASTEELPEAGAVTAFPATIETPAGTEAVPDLEKTRRTAPGLSRTFWIGAGIAASLVAAILVTWLWTGMGGGEPSTSTTSRAASLAEALPVPSLAPAPAPVGGHTGPAAPSPTPPVSTTTTPKPSPVPVRTESRDRPAPTPDRSPPPAVSAPAAENKPPRAAVDVAEEPVPVPSLATPVETNPETEPALETAMIPDTTGVQEPPTDPAFLPGEEEPEAWIFEASSPEKTITRLEPGLVMELLPAAPVAPPPGPATQPGDLVEFTRLDTFPRAIATVNPVYPRLAMRLHLEGKVVLNVLILPDGEVSAVNVLSGPHAALQKAAADAVRQWRYTPPMKDGVAVRTWKMEVIVFKR